MKNKKNIFYGSMLLVLVGTYCVFSYFKITYSYFGNDLSGDISGLVSVSYFSNYPVDGQLDDKDDSDDIDTNSDYTIRNIMFDLVDGYIFSYWNTEKDGTGTTYLINRSVKVTENITLYAIWHKKYSYGDINVDGTVNMDDSLLLGQHLNGEVSLNGEVLLNADVNVDGAIDEVDVDIIKQASLGTSGYSSLLSNVPVLIYDIYEGTLDGDGTGGTEVDGDKNGENDGTEEDKTDGTSKGDSSGETNTDNDNKNNGSNNKNDDSVNGGNNNDSVNSGTSNNKVDDNKKPVDKDNNNSGDKNNVVDNSAGDNLLDEEVDEDTESNQDDGKTNKSYVFVFVIGICLVALRFMILIIKKIIRIKTNNDNNI